MLPLILIDGYNFLHAVVLKGQSRAEWWSAQSQAKVIDWLLRHGGGEPAELWVVFDQRGSSPGATAPSEGPLRVLHAPDADAFIVARAAELALTHEVVVVSADRSLCDRARRHGARRLSPWKYAASRGQNA
jgi:predicted RNA-binding protein with PIN domain